LSIIGCICCSALKISNELSCATICVKGVCINSIKWSI
jgi:hypothetical protein